MRGGSGFQVYHQANSQDGEVVQRRLADDAGVLTIAERGTRRRPMAWAVEVQAGFTLGILNVAGTLVTGRLADQRIGILAPRAFMAVPGPARQVCLASRGEHQRILVAWPNAVAEGLSGWMAGRTTIDSAHLLDCPCRSDAGRAYERATEAATGNGATWVPRLLGALHELVAAAFTEPSRFTLTHLDADLPEALDQLLVAIRANPAQSWSLKDAAGLAGYSPFHLSRTFRTLVGYGLPEFVDRCRTEVAVSQVVGSDVVIDEVSASCGFGSTQALRDSFREYLGLLPSELRAAQAETGDVVLDRGRG